MPPPRVRLIRATAARPGAIAILQLHGPADSLLEQITGIAGWPLHRVRLVDFAGIDSGLAVRLNEQVTQLMPHGGPRVVQQLMMTLQERGAQLATDDSAAAAGVALDPLELYPEAADRFEALMLAALARAASPLAIDLLLDQPRRWRALAKAGGTLTADDLARSRRLDRLIDPPRVVLAGAPNIGKSTLSNALLGRSMSIALDQPGTTRDYTAARIEMAGLVVDWHDTPGLRETSDPLEATAIELAQRLLRDADFVIAMRDPSTDWPALADREGRGENADLQVLNKADLQYPATPGGEALRISARTGVGIAELVRSIREALVPPRDLEADGVWLFDERLLQG